MSTKDRPLTDAEKAELDLLARQLVPDLLANGVHPLLRAQQLAAALVAKGWRR